ncbi:hypothetical protein TNCV_396921 [Trichonephila clavipes]|nr:hypothetical protein TNCV_396921 [Trichonephila clavipes]
MPYSGFEPEPTRSQAECHNHHTVLAGHYKAMQGLFGMDLVLLNPVQETTTPKQPHLTFTLLLLRTLRHDKFNMHQPLYVADLELMTRWP